jgi:hypothetical protein
MIMKDMLKGGDPAGGDENIHSTREEPDGGAREAPVRIG